MATIADVARYIPSDITIPDIDPSVFTFPDVATGGSNLGTVNLDFGIPGVDPFTYDFAAAEKEAYNSLKDFYSKLLEFAGGSLDLAKRMLEYTYQSGIRQAQQTYEQGMGELNIAFPTETNELLTAQNRRGIYSSGFGKTEREQLQESQNIRKLAVERALENRQSELSATRGFGNEQAQRDFTEKRFNLERERQKEAGEMASQKYDIKSSTYQAQLAKAQQEEQRRIQKEQNESVAGLFNTASTPTSSYYSSGNNDAFRKYMAESGKQSELDTATAGGTMQGSAYQQLKARYGF